MIPMMTTCPDIIIYMYMKAEFYYNQAGIIQRTSLKLTRHWISEWLSHGKKRRDIFWGLLCEQRHDADGIKIKTVHQLKFPVASNVIHSCQSICSFCSVLQIEKLTLFGTDNTTQLLIRVKGWTKISICISRTWTWNMYPPLWSQTPHQGGLRLGVHPYIHK